MNFGIWQIVLICMAAFTIAVNLAKHGEPREGNYNVFTALISVAIEIAILAAGGFFSK